jgi:16S rRNA G1207 methylase RsmC
VSSAARRKKSSKNKHSSVVIQVRRIYSDKGVFVKTEVDIKGTLLLEELKSIHEDTRGVFLGDTSNTVRDL